MDRTTWLEARRKGLGGTDAAAILGLSRWRTAVDVYEDKLGISPEQPVTAPMRWGLALEDAIADAYTEETGYRTRRVGMRKAHHVKDFPMLGSIDRMTYLRAGEPRVVELKTARSSDGFAGVEEWPSLPPERRIPADYYVQVQHYLEVTRLSFADVAVLFGGSDFRVIEIPRDEDFGADLRAELGAFWRDYVLTETYPPAGADDLANLSRRWSSTDDETVATAELSNLVDRYLERSEALEGIEKQRDEYKAKIMEAMGAGGRLLASSATVTWRGHERTTTSWKEVALAYRTRILDAVKPFRLEPDVELLAELDSIAASYAQTSTVRPFRVDRKKEESK